MAKLQAGTTTCQPCYILFYYNHRTFQELLAQRKEKLQIQEQMMKEKAAQKVKIDKIIDQKKRRGNYCEKELLERIVFDKDPKKK